MNKAAKLVAEPSGAQWQRLIEAARAASQRAYAPRSGFPVGAAVLTASGAIFSGCNVENASYGLSICAERNAIFQAVAAGERVLWALAVYTPTPSPVTPCGACRQVIWEFGADTRVLCLCDGLDTVRRSARELLPDAFEFDG